MISHGLFMVSTWCTLHFYRWRSCRVLEAHGEVLKGFFSALINGIALPDIIPYWKGIPWMGVCIQINVYVYYIYIFMWYIIVYYIYNWHIRFYNPYSLGIPQIWQYTSIFDSIFTNGCVQNWKYNAASSRIFLPTGWRGTSSDTSIWCLDYQPVY